MPSLNPSHQHEIDALLEDITKNKPKDLIQHCANYFNRRLESDRATHLAGSSSAMADTAGPFDRARNPQTIQEEDEEHDTLSSPRQTNFRSGGSTFTNSSPFGAAAGGAAGGLFGNWLGGQSGPDDAEAAQHTPANFPGAGRRTSVSAEAMQPDADSGNWKPPQHHKTPEQLERLRAAVSSNFLFTHLDEESFSLVLGALGEKAIPAANIRVINQGDEGDYFYVIEHGDFDVYIHGDGAPSGADVGKKVATVGPGGSKCCSHDAKILTDPC